MFWTLTVHIVSYITLMYEEQTNTDVLLYYLTFWKHGSNGRTSEIHTAVPLSNWTLTDISMEVNCWYI